MDKDIKFIKGVGEVRAKSFLKLGVTTIEDLLCFYPRSYEDRTKMHPINECQDGETVCLSGTVFSAVREVKFKNKMTHFSFILRDETGTINVCWYNNRFVKSVFRMGDKYVFYGKVGMDRGKLSLINPIFERVGENKSTGKIVPVYPLRQGLVQKNIISVMQNAFSYVGEIKDFLPPEIIEKYKLCSRQFALSTIHFPKNFEDLNTARDRLIFEEFLVLQLALLFKKRENTRSLGYKFESFKGVNSFVSSLSFKLTGAQNAVIKEIFADFKSGIQMNRLIQGDVGSGKTIVAAIAMLVAAKNGYQSIIMAPTEILASQHYEDLRKMFSPLGINVVLLSGSLSAADKRMVYEQTQSGLADIIVGTHAVIQEKAKYSRLGLVIADEQHRFGVSQRAKLIAKGENPHLLVMSATPIPRTLALILYGDLDVSIINELPPGRKKVLTYSVDEKLRKRAYGFVKKNIDEGRQAYVVCPLVEETETLDLQNATALAKKLSDAFPRTRVGLVHGKMKPKEKDAVMSEFISGVIKILVSTTVIEVGVNVPNSSVMIIENAERFGLSQLHQLRGRVGRGEYQSYCVMITHSNNEITKKRMKIMCSSNDGFYISREDLKLRGPGDFFGTRQHGLPDLKIANLFSDGELLKLAQNEAKEIIKEKKLSECEEYEGLKKKIEKVIDNAVAMN